jgi:hypothetical protein
MLMAHGNAPNIRCHSDPVACQGFLAVYGSLYFNARAVVGHRLIVTAAVCIFQQREYQRRP